MNLEYHTISGLFPLMEGEEFKSLVRDIAENGLLEPIWLYEGQLLDGRNRYRACLELEIEPEIKEFIGDFDSALSFVKSMNIERRNLDSGQLAMVAVKQETLVERYKKEARERQATSTGGTYPQLTQKIGEAAETGEADEFLAKDYGTNREYIRYARKLKQELPEVGDQLWRGEISMPEARQELAKLNVPELVITPALPEGKYRCIVIDPPWPMKKIERLVAPDQGIELDYPIMTLEEISALPIKDLAYEDGCHVYLWVTQKYLPAGLELLETWGVKYQCVLTWVKNVGFTPFSWMYTTEHVLFGRIGNLPLLQNGLRLDFNAKTRGHSIKPEIFYERVIEASPEPRLELFARKEREGFDAWGNEVR